MKSPLLSPPFISTVGAQSRTTNQREVLLGYLTFFDVASQSKAETSSGVRGKFQTKFLVQICERFIV